MNSGLILFAIAALLQGPAASQNPLTSKTAGFTVTMPGPATEAFQTIQTEQGALVNRVFQLVQADLVYTVICAENPADIPAKEREPFLDGILQGYLKSMGGKTISEKKITFQGEPARDIVLDSPQGRLRATYFLKGKRIYQILILFTGAGKDNLTEYRKFIDSFKLIPTVGKLTDGLDSTTAWKNYRSEDGQFRIKAIGDPKETTQKLQTPDGIVEFKMMQCIGQKGENFGVTYSPVAKTDPPQIPKILYQSVATGAAENLKGKIEYRKAFESQGKPASEALISLPGKVPFEDGVYMVRMFIAGDRFFQVIYVGPRTRLQSKEVTEYFDSFRIDDELLK